MDDLLDAARSYLTAGLSVLWLDKKAPNGKIHPHGLQQPFSGTPDTPEDEELLRWAAGHELTTGIGIVIPEHLSVVDVDGEDGAQSLWAILGRTPETATGRTIRGLHFWFISPNVHRSTKLGKGLDFKGHGGYVAVWPSKHFDKDTGEFDGYYTWIDPLVGGIGLNWLPDEIEDVLARKAARPAVDRLYQSDSLDGLVKHLRNAEEGNRSNALYWAACVARDGGHSLDEALALLTPAIVTAGLPDPEARRTIRSAYNQGR